MGALTYSFFAAAWSAHRPLTYGQLLSKTKAIIADCNGDSRSHCNLPAAIAPSVREVVNFSGVQEPSTVFFGEVRHQPEDVYAMN